MKPHPPARRNTIVPALVSMVAGLVCVVYLTLAGALAQPANGQPARQLPTFVVTAGNTATAQFRATLYAQFTPRPVRFEIQPGPFRVVEDIDLGGLGLGSVALTTAPDGSPRLYVGDGGSAVRIFGGPPEFAELGRFSVPQPFALAFNSRRELFIAQRNTLNISVYDTAGRFIRTVWKQQGGTLETFAIGPDDSIYAAWQTNVAPRTAYLTRFAPNGELVYTKAIGPLSGGATAQDAVIGLAFGPQAGELVMAVTGFGKSNPTELNVLRYTTEGEIILRPRALLLQYTPRAPGVAARLPDGGIVVYSDETFAWGDASGMFRAFYAPFFLREGNPTDPARYQRMALAVLPDGKTVWIAEALANGDLWLRTLTLIDRFATPTAQP